MANGDISDMDKKIIKQVEYYFGDSNLPRDRFLQEQIRQDDGWVTLETMIKFQRLAHICDDTKAIGEALKNSKLIKVNEDKTKIRRDPEQPIPENTEQRRAEQSSRTVYAKEFPLDSSLDDVQGFFEQFGEIESVFMRKDEKKAFKGSVFTTFKTKEGMEAFLKAEDPKFNDKPLEKRSTKSEYYKAKNEERKKLQEEKEKKKQAAQNRQEGDEKKKVGNQMVKGAILALEGIEGETSREDIKLLLQDYGPIAWVDFNKGEKEAFVRYDQENQAKQVLEKVLAATENEIKLNDKKVEARVLEGEEEEEKYFKMYEDMKEKRNQNKYKRRPGGRFQNKYHGSKKFGKRSSKTVRDAEKAALQGGDAGSDGGGDNDEPQVKKAKVEETVE